jgi:hypothetical protein
LGGLDEHDLGETPKKGLGEPSLTTKLLLTDAGHAPLVDPVGPTLGELPRGSARNSKGLADLLVRLSLVAQADRHSHMRYRIAAWFVSHGSGFLRFKASILALIAPLMPICRAEARQVWNFPLSVTPRMQSTPPMVPHQTRRKTTFGRPVRVKVCPIITGHPLACVRAMNVFPAALANAPSLRESQLRGIMRSDLPARASLLLFCANRVAVRETR